MTEAPLEHSTNPGQNGVLGASYVQAVLTDDQDMLSAYRTAYSPQDLLDAIQGHVLIMGRRIATASNRTLAEIGDAFVAAAQVLQKSGL